MAFERDEALILEVLDLQDRDRIVVFLSREHGKKRGVAQGARRPHSRFAGVLQPLAKVRLDWREKEGRELVRIGGVDLLRPASGVENDLEGLLIGSYLADHMLEFAQEDEPGDLWFRLLDSSVEALSKGVDRNLTARYFEAWVLRLSGIFPAPWECPICERSLADGAVLPAGGDTLLCGPCAQEVPGHSLIADPSVIEFLHLLAKVPLEDLAEARPPSAGTLRRVEKICAQVRRRFLQRELRSYEVIRQTLAFRGGDDRHRSSAG
ncbi:MAG: DNA repair protein RecO [Acidobacteriota bacterium]